MKYPYFLPVIFAFALNTGCNTPQTKSTTSDSTTTVATNDNQQVVLPEPYATKSVINFSKVIGWPAGKSPVAPAGFTVTKFAGDLDNPRWIYIAPNGDVFVSEANTKSSGIKKIKDDISGKSKSANNTESGNRIILLRDADKDGTYETRETFLSGLNRPFGMLVIGNSFYVANTDGIWQYPYKTGETKMMAAGKKILSLPAGGYNNHWTRNLLANADNSKVYVSVGSGSNVGEHGMDNEVRRANVLEINPDGSGEKIFASGLRNPVGLAWAPGSNVLWTAVNERDELGDDLVPDYITSVKEGAFYGWPFAYYGQHEDPRRKGENPALVQKTIVPDVAVGAHTASLGLAFYNQKAFPEKYQGGAFVGQHGSWNRSQLAGYKVIFVPFKEGKPAGAPEDFLTGFIADGDKQEVYGRPVGITTMADGSILVADDSGNTIWQVSAAKK